MRWYLDTSSSLTPQTIYCKGVCKQIYKKLEVFLRAFYVLLALCFLVGSQVTPWTWQLVRAKARRHTFTKIGKLEPQSIKLRVSVVGKSENIEFPQRELPRLGNALIPLLINLNLVLQI